MEATFRAERLEGGRGRRLGLWMATIGDVLRHAPSVHLDILRRDARLALRTLTARPVALTMAVLTLAIGLGANIAMYAVADTVLFSPLPYRDAGTLVQVHETEGGTDASNLGYETFVDVKERTGTLVNLVAVAQSSGTVTSPDRDPERINAMRASREYFDLIGATPALGRTFLESEDRPGEARHVVILSDSLWRRRFDADPDVVGRTLTYAGVPFRIVGVMPAGLDDLVASRMYNGAELWTPLGYGPAASFACRTCRHLRVFGRLAPGATVTQAEGELSQIFASLEQAHPDAYVKAGARVRSLSDVFLGPVRPVLLALWAGVGMLLLVACGNVAHFLLLRASERAQEVAVRTALGVTRARLVRQFLTESVLLATLAGAAGLGLAWLAVRAVATNGPAQIPRLADAAVGMDGVLIALVITLLSGLAFGAVPLRHLLRRDGKVALRSGARDTESVSTWHARALLVGGNVAMAVVLLVGSGLLVRSLNGLLAVETGFNTNNLLTMELWASGERFSAGERADQVATAVGFYDEVLTRIAQIPGVLNVGATTTLPLGGNFDRSGFHIIGRLHANPQSAPNADRFAITPGYFESMNIQLVRGRLLDARDTQGAERTAVINASAAETLFGGDDPIGMKISLGPPTAPQRTIVGIAADVAHPDLDDRPGPQVYVPQAQWAWAETTMTLVIRTAGDPMGRVSDVRNVVRAVDPAQPLTNVRTMAGIIAGNTGMRRFAAALLSAFAATSLVMAVVGLYGSVALMVAQRKREIGVRLALGASASGIRRLIFSLGLRPVLLGLIVGLGLAALGVPALESMLYGVDALDAATFAWAAITLGLVGVVACAGPAYRAARIDPASAVRD
jgi:predicted permease